MARYGGDYSRGSAERGGGYDAPYGTGHFIAQSRGFLNAPFRNAGPPGRGDAAPRHRRGYDADLGAAEARRRQMREEHRFQQERAAPGEELGWGREEVYGGYSGPRGRGRGPESWQPAETPTAGSLMTENPEVVTPESTLAEAARKMRDLDVGIVPVVDDLDSRRLQGVITDRDIAIRSVAQGTSATATVEDCMTRDVATCHPDDRVRDVLHVMEREQVRRVPIVDHAGSLVGIIAQADLAVDFAEGDEHRELRVESAIGRISLPARPRRGGGGRP